MTRHIFNFANPSNTLTSFPLFSSRFALNGPASPIDKRVGDTLRCAFGNGMRPEVWGPFQERFNIGHVIEFYGATEGNVSYREWN